MNKEFLIKKLAELNAKTDLVIHKKLSKIITNSFNDNDISLNKFSSENKDGSNIYFDINIEPIKELMNKTDIEKVKINPISLE
jgi:hypothetical protein